MHLREKRFTGAHFQFKKPLIIFPHRYLDKNKLSKVPSDAFIELISLKYL